MPHYSFIATFPDAELYQIAYALQCSFGANDSGDVDLAEIDSTDGIEAWKAVLFLNPQEHGEAERQIIFTQEQVDEVCDALRSHIADTEDLTDRDRQIIQSAISRLEIAP